eukprot:CAMPEP_0197629820 /NCGR_PEP_ID=MMETSP1338-20131121/7525_1 /TAXON_ID=43686 ORGANISM="Pelagodinium beii, Strain RCC1491" /NCGR_SAMPLE_ID=MMETSP1338 /ASSEMBLY_ACC=CAM_ASM_000754 /LENGTH=369 /DNA_ID=CAMNT_0043200925 /DNA_START=46 /DNA_END=1153 /DNA_ORIENTATION=+
MADSSKHKKVRVSFSMLFAPLPPGFRREGPAFNEQLHLALKFPTKRVHLSDLGNSEAHISSLVTGFAQSNAFQVLSAPGMATLSGEIERLEHLAVASQRIPRVLRGASLRSRFIHGLCHSQALASLVSEIAQTELIAHPMEIMNGHINLTPAENTQFVDRWHRDTTQFVLVLFCTSPDGYDGGEFEFFAGTVAEAELLLKEGKGLPEDGCRLLGRQEQGSAVLQHGSEVYHRVRPVSRGKNRTTFVQSFVPKAIGKEPCSRLSDTYNGVDPLVCLLPDWARFRCWRALRLCENWLEVHGALEKQKHVSVQRATQKLRDASQLLPYTADRHALSESLNASVVDLRAAVDSASSSCPHGLDTTLLKNALNT